jgi:hypothetical protein
MEEKEDLGLLFLMQMTEKDDLVSEEEILNELQNRI